MVPNMSDDISSEADFITSHNHQWPLELSELLMQFDSDDHWPDNNDPSDQSFVSDGQVPNQFIYQNSNEIGDLGGNSSHVEGSSINGGTSKFSLTHCLT